MWWQVKLSSRLVKEHGTDKLIKPKRLYIRVHNGTIGQGARYINISLDAIFEELALKTQSRQNATIKNKHKVDHFTADDIPF